MGMNTFSISAPLWQYSAMKGTWYFVTVPKKESDALKKGFGQKRKGWGSIPVFATINGAAWETSIFPDSNSGCYVMPIKAKVRQQESLALNAPVQFSITVNVRAMIGAE
jgi:hypothetical protein